MTPAGPFALLALGGNMPHKDQLPQAVLAAALAAVDQAGLPVLRTSRFYRTPCFPAGAGPDYVNAVAVLDVSHQPDPAAVLALLHRVEAQFGRVRGARWAGRTLDLDLLAMGALIWPDSLTQRHWRDLPLADQARLVPDQVILPHPRIQDRAFVLVPLCDVAPEWVHPTLGQTAAALCNALPAADRAAVQPL